MKKYAINYRKKTIKELEKEMQSLNNEINKLKIDWTINKPRDTKIIVNKHKKLSVLMTILGEKTELEKLEKIK